MGLSPSPPRSYSSPSPHVLVHTHTLSTTGPINIGPPQIHQQTHQQTHPPNTSSQSHSQTHLLNIPCVPNPLGVIAMEFDSFYQGSLDTPSSHALTNTPSTHPLPPCPVNPLGVIAMEFDSAYKGSLDALMKKSNLKKNRFQMDILTQKQKVASRLFNTLDNTPSRHVSTICSLHCSLHCYLHCSLLSIVCSLHCSLHVCPLLTAPPPPHSLRSVD